MKIFIVILVVVVVFVATQAILTRRLINIGVALSKQAVPFSRVNLEATERILVIGDSTAVGTGAESPEVSIAGRVGQTFPNAEITNLGVNGAKTHELIPRLEKIKDQHYELIMVHIGGNDIVRFTNLDELTESIASVLDLATTLADNVTLTTTGNMGTAKLLPFASRGIYESRTRKVRTIFKEAAEKRQVLYVDLFREKPVDPFALDPDKFYAADIFHPSGEGYEDWYKIIYRTLEKISF